MGNGGWGNSLAIFVFCCIISVVMATRQRLYCDQPLVSGDKIGLTEGQAHYVAHVLRLQEGDEVALFNGRDGEFEGRLLAVGRRQRTVEVVLGQRIRAGQVSPALVLGVAVVRRPVMEAIARQATELGVTRLVPVVTEFSQRRGVNVGRLTTIAVEAAEQCGRGDVPEVTEAVALADFIKSQTASDGQCLLFCDEAGHAHGTPNMLDCLAAAAKVATPSILIGPEGGFSAGERANLLASKRVHAVSLGEAVLRVDTAVVVALGLWRAMRRKG